MDNKDASILQVGRSNEKTIRTEFDDSALHDVDYDEVYSLEEQRKIIRKIDFRVVSTLAVLYTVSLMDRINLSTAAIAGLNQELKLQVGTRYSVIILNFFAAYTVFQPIGTILTRKIGPRWFLCSIVLAWGFVMIGNGFVKTWQQMAGLRVLIGVLEAGFFPGAVYLLSTWYARYDIQKRYTVFYGVACIATAFCGILAYALSQMKGLAGLSGWRWIFIIEGIMTCVAALLSYFFLVGFPEDAHRSSRFLTEQERDFVIRRINRDRDDAVIESFSWAAFLKPVSDFKIWVFAFMFFCATTVGYSINYFLPIILLSMGFNVAQSQCLIAPPWLFTGLFMYAQAWFGDRYRLRGPIIALNALLALIGLVIMGFHKHNPTRYFGVFLVIAGASGNIPPVLTYQANNIRGQWKRAFASATIIGAGGIGGIAGALVFRSQDQPKYQPGIYASIACNRDLLADNAISLLTPAAKALIKDFYGHEVEHAYYRGCTTGGAQGFSLAEFHPDLFDGIISGCPANWFTHLMLSFLWNAQHTNTNTTSLPGPILDFIQASVIQECDTIDGVADKLIENPLACPFNISSLACPTGAPADNATCLTPSQLSAAKAIYQGPVRSDSLGTSLFPGISLGSEAGWLRPQVQGALSNAFSVPTLQNLVYQNLSYDLATFNWGSDADFLDACAGPLVNAINANLSSFRNSGKKMIVYAGWADPNIAPMWSIQHVEAITQTTIGPGTAIEDNDFVKRVMVPGGGHCGANIAKYPYVPAQYGFSAALVEWVEMGQEPVEGINS